MTEPTAAPDDTASEERTPPLRWRERGLRVALLAAALAMVWLSLRRSFPPVGIAVPAAAGAWCAEFPTSTGAGQVDEGRSITLVFAGPGEPPARRAVVTRARGAPCRTVRPQPRWEDYAAYDLKLAEPPAAGDSAAVPVALAVASDAEWSRDANGLPAADLDGDKVPEVVRVCADDAGEQFSIWSEPPNGTRRRRALEYFESGSVAAPPCTAEDARD